MSVNYWGDLVEERSPKPEFAHYYGGWIWGTELIGWIKSLLLFFDGIALGLPPATANRLIECDPVLAQPLAAMSLLRNYWPEPSSSIGPPPLWLYGTALQRMNDVSRRKFNEEVITFEEARDAQEQFLDKVCRSIEGMVADGDLREAFETYARRFLRAVKKFGYSGSDADILARASISTFLRQYVTDVAVQPIIDNENSAHFITAIIGARGYDLADIVADDFRYVGIDLKSVPLDEIIDFRRQYGSEYREYSRDIRKFIFELSLLSKADRTSVLRARRAELDDRADRLRRIGRNAFNRQTVGLGFGIAGAAWTLVHGDAWGAILAVGSAAAGYSPPAPSPVGGAYTYILRAKAQLAR